MVCFPLMGFLSYIALQKTAGCEDPLPHLTCYNITHHVALENSTCKKWD